MFARYIIVWWFYQRPNAHCKTVQFYYISFSCVYFTATAADETPLLLLLPLLCLCFELLFWLLLPSVAAGDFDLLAEEEEWLCEWCALLWRLEPAPVAPVELLAEGGMSQGLRCFKKSSSNAQNSFTAPASMWRLNWLI